MDVDVDVGRVDLDIEEIARETVFGNHLQIGVLDGMMEIGVLDKALVHKEILLASRLSGIFRLDDIAVNADAVGLLMDMQKPLVVSTPKESHDALLEVAGIKMVDLLAVAGQAEAYFRIHQRDTGELLYDMAHLGLGRLEEVAPCRDVEKQVLDGERGAWLHGDEGLFLHYRPFVDNLGAHLVFLAARLEFHLGDGCDARQGLATEAHRADGEQVLSLADLRRGMTLKAQSRVGLRHATAVVDHHDHRLASVFHHQVDLGGSGIQRVFHQLFDSRCRTLYHLACRNLVGNAVGKQFDDVKHTLIFPSVR